MNPLQPSSEDSEILQIVNADDPTSTVALSSKSTVSEIDLEEVNPRNIEDLPPPGSFLGRTKLSALISHSPNMVVYRGVLWDIGVDVAVKMIQPTQSIHRLALENHLHNEYQILKMLTHQDIPRLWDYREAGNHVPSYLATDLIPSVDLNRMLMNHGGQLSPRQCIRLALRIIAPLQYAHRNFGIVHRDVKPSNILVRPNGAIQLIDWSLASIEGEMFVTSALANPNVTLGTPAYLAPEIALRQPVDYRADIYSLGCTLYQMVTGRLPFDHKDSNRIIRDHVSKQPIPPFEYVQTPHMLRLSEVILHMLEKNPADRYQSYDDLIYDLQWILEHTI